MIVFFIDFLLKPHSHLRIFVRTGLHLKMFIHYLLVLRNKNTLMWPPAYVFRISSFTYMISLRTKIFVRKETHVSEEKKNIAQSHSNCIQM